MTNAGRQICRSPSPNFCLNTRGIAQVCTNRNAARVPIRGPADPANRVAAMLMPMLINAKLMA